MNASIRWLTPRMVIAFHNEALFRFGGDTGLRDEDLLDSALARPQNRAAYDSAATPYDLAAEYCTGIVRNHPFVDGNKRVGLLSAVAFLSLNGRNYSADEADVVTMIENLAAGNVEIDTLAAWFAANCGAG